MKRIALTALLIAAPLAAQDTLIVRGKTLSPLPARPASPYRGTMDTARARELYVSKTPADLRGCGAQCDDQIKAKHRTDSIYAAKAPGNYEFQKIKYKSRADG